MSTQKTNAEFLSRIQDHLNKNNLVMLGEYHKAKQGILFRHTVCGYEFFKDPDHIFRNIDRFVCPKCYGRRRLSRQDFIDELKAKLPNIDLIGEYSGARSDVLLRCKSCGYVWKTNAWGLLNCRSIGCLVCAKQVIGPAPKFLNSIWSSQYKEFASLYMTEQQMKENMPFGGKRIFVKCPDCGLDIYVSPAHLMRKEFSCTCKDGISYPNKFMYALLHQLNILFVPEYKIVGYKKRYDIYIPEKKIIIENHGMQHYKESTGLFGKSTTLESIQNNDLNKMSFAIENGISNYIVLDCRFSNVSYIKESILKSGLLNILNVKESDIDWAACDDAGHSNMRKVAIDLYKNGICLSDIAKALDITYSCVWKWVKQENNK